MESKLDHVEVICALHTGCCRTTVKFKVLEFKVHLIQIQIHIRFFESFLFIIVKSKEL